MKHSRTSSTSSYDKDFRELIQIYATSKEKKRKTPSKLLNYEKDHTQISRKTFYDGFSDEGEASVSGFTESEDECSDQDDTYASLENGNSTLSPGGLELTAEYLEDEVDVFHSVDDLDGIFGS